MGIAVFPAAGGGVIPQSQTFTSSGTFTLPAGYGVSKPLIVDIEICGGGGGGGGGAASNQLLNPPGSGGGGGSGVCVVYRGISLTANATVTIGAGGSGGASVTGAPVDGNNGANGGDSNVNSIYFAPGGGGGSAGRYNAQTRLGGNVIANGWYINGGYTSNGTVGPGGGGGSGGAAGNNAWDASSVVQYRGGIHGSAACSITSNSVTNSTWNFVDSAFGKGINSFSANAAVAMTSGNTLLYTELGTLQRGGGGGGGGSSQEFGGGGQAGTINNGGFSGYRNSLALTGSQNGQSATDAGCGGGGGGVLNPAAGNGTGGSGGNGAAGYCIIRYMA